jgi:hypothetical protein
VYLKYKVPSRSTDQGLVDFKLSIQELLADNAENTTHRDDYTALCQIVDLYYFVNIIAPNMIGSSDLSKEEFDFYLTVLTEKFAISTRDILQPSIHKAIIDRSPLSYGQTASIISNLRYKKYCLVELLALTAATIRHTEPAMKIPFLEEWLESFIATHFGRSFIRTPPDVAESYTGIAKDPNSVGIKIQQMVLYDIDRHVSKTKVDYLNIQRRISWLSIYGWSIYAIDRSIMRVSHN